MNENEIDTIAIFVGRHAKEILTLMQVGFFDMHNGSMTVHFGNEGTIRKIEKNNVFSVS